MRPFLYAVSMGLGVYTVQLAQGLSRKDQVAIAVDADETRELFGDFPTYFHNAPFNLISVEHYAFPDPRKLSEAWRVSREIGRHKPDVVHVTLGGLNTEALAILGWPRLRGVPFVATVHDPWFHPGDLPPLRTTRIMFHVQNWCSVIIVHGRQLAEYLVRDFGVDERCIRVIPHGNYDIYLQAAGGRPAPAPAPGRVLLFGRMKKYKGLDVLIEAAPLVAKEVPHLKIVLAGKGEELDRFEPRLRADPLFEIHKGWLPAQIVPELFTSASLIVIPYIEASQSGPLHLAFTWGRPVVASRVGAIPESLTHDREGLLVPPQDPQALAQAMISVLTDPVLAERLGRAGRLKAETDLDWAGEISQATRSAYEQAIEMKRKGISYPGRGPAFRWGRIKEFYRQQARIERRR